MFFKKKKTEEEIKAKKKKRRTRKLFLLTVLGGGGAALAYSKNLRTTVLDKLFGAEKEFNYTPPAGDSGTAPDA